MNTTLEHSAWTPFIQTETVKHKSQRGIKHLHPHKRPWDSKGQGIEHFHLHLHQKGQHKIKWAGGDLKQIRRPGDQTTNHYKGITKNQLKIHNTRRGSTAKTIKLYICNKERPEQMNRPPASTSNASGIERLQLTSNNRGFKRLHLYLHVHPPLHPHKDLHLQQTRGNRSKQQI